MKEIGKLNPPDDSIAFHLTTPTAVRPDKVQIVRF